MRQLALIIITCLTVLMPCQARAATPYNQWNGTGPISPVTGDRSIGALLVRSDGILFSGNGSGTVFSYESKAPDAATGGANAVPGTSATLSATVNANNAATTITFQYGTTTGYGNSATATQSPLAGSTATEVTASISGLTNGATYHYRVAATSSAGAAYGADQAFTAGQAMAVVTLGNLAFTYNGAPKSTTVTTSPSGLAVTITYNGSTTPPASGGSYTVTATVNDANYQGSATGTLVIAKANATVTLTPASLSATYDGAPKAAAATTSPPGLAAGFTYDGSASASASAGSHAVVATISDTNYQGTTSGTLVIAKANQAITFATLPVKTYGDADFGAGATVSSGLPLTYSSDNEAVATVAADGQIHIVAAGGATITATQAGDANYNAASAQTLALTVSKATITVTADNKSRAYGATDPVFTATYSGFVKGEGATVITGTSSFTTSATAASPQGSYSITPVVSGLTAANYTFAAANGTLAVGLVSQTITFNPLPAKTYGDATFTLAASGGISGNSLTYSSSDTSVAAISGATVTIVGSGTTTITADQTGTTGAYATATAQQSLTVNKTTITVTANSATRQYNSANPALTASYSGFVNNEDATVISGTPTVTTTATPASPVGSYPVTVALGTLTAVNYDFTFVSGTLGVGLASQAITFAPPGSKTYGDATFELNAFGGASGNPVTFISSNEAVATVSGATVIIIGAGTSTITASQAGNSNYASATAQQTLTVGKAPLTVTAQNASRAYGEANPAFTAAFSGFVNNEDSTVLQGAPSFTTSADAASAPGNYPITVAIGNLFSNNYSFSYVNGTLVIGKATPVIIWNTPAAITAGTALSISQLNASAGVAGSFAYTPVAGTILSAGSHTLSVSFTPNDGNYSSASASVSITVNAAPVISDTTAPTMDAFTIPVSAHSLTIPITSFTASDANGVIGYLVSENASQPTTDAVWSATAPVEYTFSSQGSKTLYAFAKDAAGNVSVPLSASVTITLPDTTVPTVTNFTIPDTAASLIVPVTNFDGGDDTAITTWLLSETATAMAGDSRWSATKPSDYTFGGQGTKTLYAFAKDVAGNVSAPLSATVVITLLDTTAPTVDAVTIPATASSLTVALNAISATDTSGVTGYFISESATPPAADATGWSATAPTSYTFASQGNKTLYIFAKDAAGNVSLPVTASVTITLSDTTAPSVTSFTIPATSASLTVAVTSFTASDDTAVTGYLLSETATATAGSGNWTVTSTSSYTFATAGAKTLYAFAKDAAGNISAAATAAVVITLPDTTAPVVSGFTVTGSATSLTVAVTNFSANDDTAVTGYIISESAVAPAAAASGWTSTPPASYTFATGGSKTLYAYAKDAAGNVSTSAAATVTVSTVLRNGNGGSGTDPTIADALKALQAYLGLVTLSSDDQIRYDVAPLSSSGVPEGNGVVDFSDAIIILRRSIGIGSW
ncbi:beta strand repeat-containing protein [Geotalea uraniireducens]|uniref:Fibronectin type-III domain-containing protein n=1 Tax=Geotalea uraniireducens (strain Rf4) TaxID=351605 RepID=A5GBR8_GEOUR|nr:MBG domain-containing protein [Geotalea uraniireducens]ABQ24971.1 hypothetical protein Gura_0762 [Geotalea uraniireducens Rf4]